MPTTPHLTRCLAALACLLLASGCASKAPTTQRFPDAALVQRETEPQLTQAHVDGGEQGLNDYDAEFKAWAKRGWDKVDAGCRWFRDMGAPFDCPPPPPSPQAR